MIERSISDHFFGIGKWQNGLLKITYFDFEIENLVFVTTFISYEGQTNYWPAMLALPSTFRGPGMGIITKDSVIIYEKSDRQSELI